MIAASNALKVMLSWNDDREKICSTIIANKSFLKIIVKVKNDPQGLHEWIKYYSGIVDPRDLIIFDNMSDEENMIEYCSGLIGEFSVFKFSGFQDNIHNTNIFSELYDALSKSSQYFAFFDIDERLMLFEDGRQVSGELIVPFLKRHDHVDVFPGTWLDNAMGSGTIFFCGTSINTLEWGVTWGKPILKSSMDFDVIMIHNIQINQNKYSDNTPLNFVCLHLKNLDPIRRVKVNIAKLIAQGVIIQADEIYPLLETLDRSLYGSNILMYMDEIRRMSQGAVEPVTRLSSGHFEIESDGNIKCFSNAEFDILSLLWSKSPSTIAKRVLWDRS
jgi:hypothetical protein